MDEGNVGEKALPTKEDHPVEKRYTRRNTTVSSTLCSPFRKRVTDLNSKLTSEQELLSKSICNMSGEA